MALLNSVSSATTSIASVSNVLLVLPQLAGLFNNKSNPQNTIGYQPQNPTSFNGQIDAGVKALLFHYEGEQTVALESDITDHFVEDNTAVQDHIALKPEIITTHGYIGELNNVPPLNLPSPTSITNRLAAIPGIGPSVSTSALIAANTAFQLYQTGKTLRNTAVQAYQELTGNGGTSVINEQGIATKVNFQNEQQTMFQVFYGYWKERRLFTVQTPWAVFQNMAIKSLRAIQDEQTQVITDFEVSFKMIRTASTISNAPVASGRLSLQSLLSQQLGTFTPKAASLDTGIFG